MIREAFERGFTNQPGRKLTTDLWVSDLGNHPAKAMMRVLNGEQEEFTVEVKEKMQFGNVLEADTASVLAHNLSSPMIAQFPLYNDIWSGYADLVIDHLSDRVTILEHKVTGDKWFDYKGSLPRAAHVCQLWMYGRLYEETYGMRPRLILYYRAFGHYAELELSEERHRIVAEGMIDGEPVHRYRLIVPDLLRQELERYYLARELPVATEEEVKSWDYAEEAYGRLLRGV